MTLELDDQGVPADDGTPWGSGIDVETREAPANRREALRNHLATPLFANAYALIGSTGITTALGFAYWVVATRLYPIEEVGRGQAAVNALIILSGLGSFRLISALMRFMPRAGVRSRTFLLGCYATAAAGSAAVGLGYVVLFRGNTTSHLGPGVLAALAMTGSVVIWSLFTLQDAALTGLRAARLVPVKNGLHGVAKLLVLPLFAAAGFLSTGVFASWMIPTLLVLIPFEVVIARTLLPRTERSSLPIEELSGRKIRDYVAADYAGSLSELAVVNLIPLIIAAHLGLEAVGYFGPTWMIATMLDHVLVHFGSSLMVEGASSPERLPHLARELLRRSVFVIVPITVVIALGAPLLLGVYGPDFPSQVGNLLRLSALALVPRLVIHVSLTAARVRGEVRRVVGIQLAMAVLTFAVSMPLLDRFGLTAPGLGYLVASFLVALALVRPLIRLLSEAQR